MAIEALEGDFVLQGASAPLMRMHMTRDSMVITTGGGLARLVIVANLSEATELRDWLDRRLSESIE